MRYRALLILSLVAASADASLSVQTSDEEATVLAVVQKFFDTMASKDADGARKIIDPDGSFVSVRWQDGKQLVRRSLLRDYLETLEDGELALLERMWDPEVLIRGPIAIVWTEYDFHRDGEFSHCGMDAFQLTKMDSGWAITGGTYTVETTGCPDGPLGPPGPK